MTSRLLMTQTIESVGRLGAGIAHEINTPSQYISDNTSFLSVSFQQFARFFAATRNLRLHAATVPELAADAAALAEVEQAVGLEYLIGEIPCAIEQTLQGLGQIKRIVTSLKEFSHPVGREEFSFPWAAHGGSQPPPPRGGQWKNWVTFVKNAD